MEYGWLDAYCLSRKGAEKEYKPEWDATLFKVAGKMFALKGGDKYGKPIISMKHMPAHGEILRNEHKDIVPGYYLNKVHWSSVYLEGDVPEGVIKAMVDESYGIVLSSLSRKARAEISNAE